MENYKWPTPVGPGATVGIVSLGAPDAGDNPLFFERGLEWLKSRGMQVKVGSSTLGNNGFLADTPANLVSDLNDFLRDPEVSLIMAAGGGANCNQLLRHLDLDLFSKEGKGLIGLSNPTVLLNALTAHSGVISFHGPAVVWNLGGEEPLDDYSERHMWKALRQDRPMIIDSEETWSWLRPGICDGVLFGGNLWSLQQLLGTPWEPDWTNAILFIEDCFTQLHQIDAILTHFDDAGVFNQIAGLVVGVFESCSEEDYSPAPTTEQIVMRIVDRYNFPVLAGVHLGHTSRKITVPIGASARLDSTQNSFVVR